MQKLWPASLNQVDFLSDYVSFKIIKIAILKTQIRYITKYIQKKALTN